MPVCCGNGMKSPSLLVQCRLHSREAIKDDSEIHSACCGRNLVEEPRVDALDLPYIWADLGQRFHRGAYFVRADNAAEAINDHALAAWSKRKAMELGTN
jgi:hypothetical protein